MDKTKAKEVINNLQKKDKTPKEIHEDTIRIFVEDFTSYATVKKSGQHNSSKPETAQKMSLV